MPVADFSQGLEINVADLKEMIQQVVFAASTDDARPILTGVLISVHGDQITLAAADGFRLSVRKGDHLLAGCKTNHRGHPGQSFERAGAHRRRWRKDFEDGDAPWARSGDLPAE